MATYQMALDVPDVTADPFADLDLELAESQALARRRHDRADGRRPVRCRCAHPLVEVEDDGIRCVKCGRRAT